MTESLLVTRLNSEAKLPTRAHAGDAGLDLYSVSDITLAPREPVRIPTGVAMALPAGHVGLICDRSSLGSKGLRVLGGVVDAGYRGEVQVVLINLRNEPLTLAKGDKIAQMLILPVNLCGVEERKSLNDTTRSTGGFGSTGR
ncbi:MAG: dUTP diphosphatase [Deltaproteobacteria bacterium]|nr:dUTP diphosphatase [Deltaproteobacteria bacterium]